MEEKFIKQNGAMQTVFHREDENTNWKKWIIQFTIETMGNQKNIVSDGHGSTWLAIQRRCAFWVTRMEILYPNLMEVVYS